VVVVAAAACSAAWGAQLAHESWLDAEHGWKVVPLKDVLETNDGGRTWRRLPNPQDSETLNVLRTGLTTGLQVDSVTDHILWTNDSGRHWSYAKQIGTPTTGSGRFLFWAHGRTLYRVLPWPPPWRCISVLRGSLCGYRDSSGRMRAGRLQSVVVARVPEGNLRPTVIPGGVVAATSTPDGTTAPYALVARYLDRSARPRVRIAALPHPPGSTLYACRAPMAEWPRVTIEACRWGGGDDPVTTWLSDNGGTSWRLTG